MKILLTGDLAVTKEYSASLISRDVVELFNGSNLNISNLETPVTNSFQKAPKTGPHLNANRSSIADVLKILDIDIVTLANNHVMDYGDRGLLDTLDFCKNAGIKTVGAGKDIHEASEVLYLNESGIKIGIINFAENEWTSATSSRAGFNPMDIIDNCNQIKETKKNSDFVLVLIHGGHEYYSLPSPRMVKQYRFYAECGADLIVGHHTHCLGGMEIYRNVPIFYSLGNFLFTRSSSYSSWYQGTVLEVNFEKNAPLSFEFHFVEQNPENFALSLSSSFNSSEREEEIKEFSRIIASHDLLAESWKNFINQKEDEYLEYWSPLNFIENRYLKGILRRLGWRFTTAQGLRVYNNLLRCEAHRDLSNEILWNNRLDL